MSKIQGKPFIESVLDSLNDTQKTTLLSYVNGTNKNPQFRSLINSENWITKLTGEDTGDYDKVSHIILETYNKTYTGYLIYNASYCVLIAYALNSQELNVLDINLTNKSYKLIKTPFLLIEWGCFLFFNESKSATFTDFLLLIIYFTYLFVIIKARRIYETRI